MRARWAVWLGTLLAFSGCGDNRRAGTEVGNPEITVSARFFVSSYGYSHVWALYFNVMGMGYSVALPGNVTDSGKCWGRPLGTLVNFADAEGAQLPDTMVQDAGIWPHAEIVLRTPDGPTGTPDSGDIDTWSNPRYAKFFAYLMGRPFTVLFEMPPAVEYRLLFDSTSIGSWWVDKEIWVPFNLSSDSWTDTLTAFPAFRTRLDGKGQEYVLISPTENARAWNALKATLPRSFYADSVIVR
jgi:hypothetical protein